MKSDKSPEEEIDRYLDGSMKAEEKAAFETKMANDIEFAREVELQRSIIRAVRRQQLKKIVQREEEMKASQDVEKKIIKRTKIRKLVISIVPLAAAACIFGFFYLGNLKNCNTLYTRYFALSDASVPSRGETYATESDSVFIAALANLEQGNKKQAIRQLESLNNSTSDMTVTIDQGVKWYLSLAYLKNGQKKKAKNLLTEIISMPDCEFKSKSEELLKVLR